MSVEAQNLFAALTEGGPLSSGCITGEGVSFSTTDGMDDYLRNQMMVIMIPAKGSELVLMVTVDYAGLDPAGSGKAGVADLVTPGLKMILPIVTLQQVLTHLSDMMTAEEKEKMNFQSTQPSETLPKVVETHEEDKGLAKMPDLHGLSLRKSLRLLKGNTAGNSGARHRQSDCAVSSGRYCAYRCERMQHNPAADGQQKSAG